MLNKGTFFSHPSGISAGLFALLPGECLEYWSGDLES